MLAKPKPTPNDETAETADTVCAVAVTFHPVVADLERLLAAVAPQVNHLVVVDNGSSLETRADLRELCAGRNGIPATLIQNDVNAGIGAAQNQGIEYALAQGCDFVLLLDQDSMPDDAMVASLLNAYHQVSDPETAAAFGPAIIETKIDKPSYFVRLSWLRYLRIDSRSRPQPVSADILIASGCLMPRHALQTIGLMDASLFIDRVDTEWCLRARAAGFRCFGVGTAHLRHSIGHAGLKLGRFRREVALHSPLRHYYAFRNSILLMHRGYVGWQWRINETLLLLQMLGVYLTFAPERVTRATMIVRGILHGLLGRSGPLGRDVDAIDQ